MAYPKGVSGNPGGRPKDSEELKAIKDELRKLCPEAVEGVAKYLKSRKFPEIKWAIEMALSYGIGKPAQALEFSEEGSQQLAAILEIVRKDPK